MDLKKNQELIDQLIKLRDSVHHVVMSLKAEEINIAENTFYQFIGKLFNDFYLPYRMCFISQFHPNYLEFFSEAVEKKYASCHTNLTAATTSSAKNAIDKGYKAINNINSIILLLRLAEKA